MGSGTPVSVTQLPAAAHWRRPHRRRALALLALLVAVLPAAACGDGAESPPAGAAAGAGDQLHAGPNLLLITLDTLRADHLGAYGYRDIETPRLDRLAAEGVRFAQVATTVPTTLPAHSSILTGELPMRHGVRNNGTFQLGDDALTIAEVMRGAGYDTAGFVAAFVLDKRFGTAQGFDQYTDFGQQAGDMEGAPALKIQRRAGEVVGEAVSWLAERNGPFFAWVHLYDPHSPYDAPEPFGSRYAERPYDGEIAYTDSAVGTLLDGLAAAGHGDDTLVVVLADHGEGLGDHGETWHTYFVYDSTVHVPMILWAPGALPGGVVVQGEASVIDVLPTALALLGVGDPAASDRDGTDLRPLIAQPDARGRASYAESMIPMLNFGWSELRALRADGWKYIEAPREELYDLADDPGELHNLLADEPDRAERLRAELQRLVGDDDPSAFAFGAQPVDPATIERLRALGYLAGGAAPDQRDVDPKDKVAVYEAFNDGIDRVNELLQQERWSDAEQELFALDEVLPDHFLVQYNLGKVSLEQGDAATALQFLQRALDLNPTYSLTYTELAKAYEAEGELDRAVDLLSEAMQAYPDVFSFPLQLGDLQLRRGRPADALMAYAAARRLIPDHPGLLGRMAGLYLQQGQPAAAGEILQQLVVLTPEDARAWGNLGMVLGGQERFEEAEEAFRRAIALSPREAPLYYNLGLVLLRRGEREQARSAFEQALDVDPRFQPARDQLARIGSGGSRSPQR
jgi:arylsulfatase A-like enzyme/Tfp pilus assembly protein PilF